MKRTRHIERAKEAAWREKVKREEEIKNLKGADKLDHEIKILESRISNCRLDIEKIGDNVLISNKIKFMEEELNKKKEELEKLK